MQIQLRLAAERDKAWLKTLHEDSYREVVTEQFGQWDEDEQTGFFTTWWQNSIVYLIILDDLPVGVLSWLDEPAYLWLEELQVSSAHRSQGIGTAVIEELLNRARGNGVPLRLQVLKANMRARALYERLGFKQVGATDTHLVLELTALISTPPFLVASLVADLPAGPQEASLWGMSYPGSRQSITQAFEELSSLGIRYLVGLLEDHEYQRLGIDNVSKISGQHAIHYMHFPIKDRNTPADPAAFAQLGEALITLLNQGESLAVHCKAGVGRTGLVLACVLGRMGYTQNEAYEIISEARQWRVPDAQIQHDWLTQHWSTIIS